MENVNLDQNTREWLQFRKSRIGSSDAPIIMGISPWQTPLQLWQKKTGRIVDEQLTTFPVLRGQKWEPAARARYELKTGMELPPTVKVHSRYKFLIASLDGFSEEDQIICEIKCLTGRKTFDEAKAGRVVDHYYSQIQHQLLVSGAKEAHFFCVLIGKQGNQEAIIDEALVIVKPDEAYQKDMLVKLIDFYNCLVDDRQPVLTERDFLEADDQSTVFLFSKIKPIKQEIARKTAMIDKLAEEVDQLEADLEALREEAIEHVESFSHPRICAVGVNMIKDKNGNWSIRLAAQKEEV